MSEAPAAIAPKGELRKNVVRRNDAYYIQFLRNLNEVLEGNKSHVFVVMQMMQRSVELNGKFTMQDLESGLVGTDIPEEKYELIKRLFLDFSRES